MNVIDLIKTELSTITNIPADIVIPNISYKPVLGKPWIRLSSTEGEPSQITIGQNRMLQYTGTCQIDVFNILGKGKSTVSEDIKTHFLKFDNRFLGTGQFKLQIQTCWIGNTVIEDNWARDIVFIRYIYTQPTPV